MLPLIVEDQTHGTFAHFRGKLVRCLAHDAPSYSGVGASGKPGAVHCPENLVAVRTPSQPRKGIEAPKRLITSELQVGGFAKDWIEYAKEADLDLDSMLDRGWLQTTHYTFALEMARRGLGIAVVPDYLAEEDLMAGRLELFTPTKLSTHEDYFLCVKDSRRKEAPLASLVHWFRAQVALSRMAGHGSRV